MPAPSPNPGLLIPRRRVEIVSTGVDEALQGLGGDPFAGTSWVGLRVPAFVTSGPENRYLFQLCSFTVGEAVNAWVRGFRQAWTLGFMQAATQGQGPRVVEQQVTDPFFKLNDGNISWHMTIMAENEPRVSNPSQVLPLVAGVPVRNLAFQTSDTPALLFQTVSVPGPFYTALTAYTPPNGGMPWGRPLTGELGTFYGLKAPWRDSQSWCALDIRVEGPARVAFYASVQQSNPASPTNGGRVALTAPSTPLNFQLGLSPEEQFLQNFPSAIIWRVAGALIVELDDHRE